MRKLKKLYAVLLILSALMSASCSLDFSDGGADPLEAEKYEFAVHFIDVGQGDSAFIECGGKYMLIDSGEEEYSETVLDYMAARGAEHLEYLVITHPHSDHMGGMAQIISENSITIGRIIMPDAVNNTNLFENMLTAIKNRGYKATLPVVGDSYKLGEAEFTVLGPESEDYSNLNNYSVSIKMTYSDISFIFTGDAEELAEKEMLASGTDLKADVMKAGHHGSETSNSEEFLKAVDPGLIIISVGKDNSYGHPHAEILRRFAALGADVYRTDKEGTVIAAVENGDLVLKSEKSGVIAFDLKKHEAQPDTTASLYRSATGNKYHLESCSYLGENRVAVSLSEAVKEGLEPCSRCKPPA